MSDSMKINVKSYEECLGDGVAWSLDLQEREHDEGFDLKLEFFDYTDGMFTTNINIWGVSSSSMKSYINALKKIQKHLAEQEKIAADNPLCN